MATPILSFFLLPFCVGIFGPAAHVIPRPKRMVRFLRETEFGRNVFFSFFFFFLCCLFRSGFSLVPPATIFFPGDVPDPVAFFPYSFFLVSLGRQDEGAVLAQPRDLSPFSVVREFLR